MVWSHVERKTSRCHSITHVDGRGERLSPEPLVDAFVVKHRPHKVHECAVHALGHPILLRSICDGQLVLDAWSDRYFLKSLDKYSPPLSVRNTLIFSEPELELY